MSKNTVKLVIFIGGLAFLIPVGLVGFTLFSNFIAAFNTGADPASIFRGHQLFIPSTEQAEWISVEPQGGSRPPTQAELEALISAYWLAWESLAQAQKTGDFSDLPTYWGGAALENAQSASQAAFEAETTFTHAGHRLFFVYFADDSSIALIRDEGFTYTLTTSYGTFALTTSVDCVLTLDNGFWRIRQYSINFT